VCGVYVVCVCGVCVCQCVCECVCICFKAHVKKDNLHKVHRENLFYKLVNITQCKCGLKKGVSQKINHPFYIVRDKYIDLE
jgi:hypothetical protein